MLMWENAQDAWSGKSKSQKRTHVLDANDRGERYVHTHTDHEMPVCVHTCTRTRVRACVPERKVTIH